MEAVQTVYFGNVLQRISPFLLGSTVFGISSILSVGIAIWMQPNQLARIRDNLGPIIRVNLFGSVAWLSYLTSIKNIEPAVAFTVFSASVPLTILFLEKTRPRGFGLAGSILLLFAIFFLGATAALGMSGHPVQSVQSTLSSVLGCVIAGVSISLVLLQSKQLNLAGLSALVVFGLRFMLFTAISFVAFLYLHSTQHPFNLDVVGIIVLGILLLAVPLYAVQRAIDISDARTVGVFTAFAPLMVVVLQVIEGRVEFSLVTVEGILIYASGAAFLALDEIRRVNDD